MDRIEIREIINEVYDYLVNAGAERELLTKFNNVIEHFLGRED